MANIATNLRAAFETLAANGINDPQRQASSLVELAIGRDKTFLFAHPEYELTYAEQEKLDIFVGRRVKGEPLQYISGKQEFYGREFIVTPDVLIPRPETEIIVEKAIELIKDKNRPRFVEVGVGSGCISVSILAEVPEAQSIATDVSATAIDIARQNAESHDVDVRLQILNGSVFADITEDNFHLIVSNPPYIPADDIPGLQTEVKDHEPHLALTDNSDGRSIIREIVKRSPHFLASGGVLLMEIGIGQADAVREMFDPAEWSSVEIIPDLQMIPRTILARLK